MIKPLDWDSKIYGKRMCAFVGKAPLQKKSLERALKQARTRGFEFVCAKAKTGDFKTVHLLEEAGFKLVDVTVTFTAVIHHSPFTIHHSPSTIQDIKFLKKIAEESFMHNRFFNDPKLPKAKTKLLYAEWVKNACRDKKAKVLVARNKNGAPIGFCICKIARPTKGKPIGYIDLIAVSQKNRKKGIGQDLIKAAFGWFSKRVNIVEIRTQAKNAAAIKSFQRAGFRDYTCGLALPSGMVFHKWLGEDR